MKKLLKNETNGMLIEIFSRYLRFFTFLLSHHIRSMSKKRKYYDRMSENKKILSF